MQTRRRSVLAMTSALLTLSACGPGGGFSAASNFNADTSSKSSGSGTSGVIDDHTPVKTPSSGVSGSTSGPTSGSTSGGTTSLNICSKLSFPMGLMWPMAVSSATDRAALKLALNISGSFEGATGWSNLTNDFDGQGLSMGLLNQTLNTGSLEPLFVQMREQSLPTLKSKMTAANLDAWLAMLQTWEGVSTGNSKAVFADNAADAGEPISRLDIDTRPADLIEKAAANRNAVAAAWARSHLYDGNGKFLASWSKDLTAMSTSAEYISVQIGAASKYHARALAYQKQFGTASLRAYLFFFDVIVQNGSLLDADIADYATWLKSNSGASESVRLGELLTLRLRHVRDEYVNDVRTRKLALINGTGTVHGATRKLETEFCFNRLTALF